MTRERSDDRIYRHRGISPSAAATPKPDTRPLRGGPPPPVPGAPDPAPPRDNPIRRAAPAPAAGPRTGRAPGTRSDPPSPSRHTLQDPAPATGRVRRHIETEHLQ